MLIGFLSLVQLKVGGEMPYKDKEKQREAVKKAVARHRVLHQGITSLVEAKVLQEGITVIPKAEVIAQLRQLIKELPQPGREAIVPLYNASVHRAGDRVRVFDGNRLVEMVIPELDADGQPVPQGVSSSSLSSSSNLMKPGFNPNPKPAKKVRKSFRHIKT